MNSKGQVTLFVIIGLVLLAVVLLVLFFFSSQKPDTRFSGALLSSSPATSLKTCLSPLLEETESVLLRQGGFIHPLPNTTLDGTTLTYLCYTENYYVPCRTQYPALSSAVSQEIHREVAPDIEQCLRTYISELEADDYDITASYRNFTVSFAPGAIQFEVDSPMEISRAGERQVYEEISFRYSSVLYDLLMVAQEIAAQEAEYCYFSTTGYGIIYPTYKITKFEKGDLTTVYTITHKPTGQRFSFATRSCAIPPGI